jgi:hypothetical protein
VSLGGIPDGRAIGWLTSALGTYKSFRVLAVEGGRESKGSVRKSLRSLGSRLLKLDQAAEPIVQVLGRAYDQVPWLAKEKLDAANPTAESVPDPRTPLPVQYADPLLWISGDFHRTLRSVQEWARWARKTKRRIVCARDKQYVEVQTELKLASKLEALVELGRHLGLFDRGSPSGTTVATPCPLLTPCCRWEQQLSAAALRPGPDPSLKFETLGVTTSGD